MRPRILHVLDSLAAGGMETTFLHALRVLRRLEREEARPAVHEVLSFADGLLLPACEAEADDLFVGSEPSFVARVLDRGYHVVHLLFERCAHRLAPLILSRTDAAMVYGKGYDLASMYRMRGILDWRAETSLLASCDAVTFTTAELAGGFEVPAGRATVLGKAFDRAGFSRVPAVTAETPDRILCVANLHPRKRLEDLIPALRRVRSRVPSAELRIVGKGSDVERERLRRKAAEEGVAGAVELAGASLDVASEMASCRVLVLPSACEGVPTVLLEAMAAGRPVVATRVGHVTGVLTDGEQGYVVEAGDVDAMADHVATLLLDRDLAARMGAAGRLRAERHDVRLVAARLHTVLAGVGSGRELGAGRCAEQGHGRGASRSHGWAQGEETCRAFLELYERVGSDAHLRPEEVGPPSDCLRDVWDTCQAWFEGFTASRLDPLFHRLAEEVPSGVLSLPDGAAVLVVGTGPSLEACIPALRKQREGLHLFTSPRGAARLEEFGLAPDLVLVEHPSALDAALTADNLRWARPLREETLRHAWVAAQRQTPPDLLATLPRERLFVPDPLPSWGLWPATAVALALRGGARSIGLLGVDLGTRANPDRAFGPLVALLDLLARFGDAEFRDCGPGGASKPGWERGRIEDLGAASRPGPITVCRSAAPSREEILAREVDLWERLGSVADRAREGVQEALEIRAGRGSGVNGSMRRWAEELESWKDDVSLRRDLQEGLSLSFLPRFWRLGLETASEAGLWRPVLLGLHELVSQHGRLGEILFEGRDVPGRPEAAGSGEGREDVCCLR